MTEITTKIIDRLTLPEGKLNMVLDTDTYNEIDDQFALVYALRSTNRLNVQAIYAAPFFNHKSNGPKEGMEKSYEEIYHVLDRMNMTFEDDFVLKGSTRYLESPDTPCKSDAVDDLIKRAMSAKEPLYVVAIGAITNVASAILIEPKIIDKIIVVWLGGHAFNWPNNSEFNLRQDIPASRVIFDSKVPLILMPCMGVVSHLSTTTSELEKYIENKSSIGAYLTKIVRECAKGSYQGSRVIWDISTIAYLINPEWVNTNIVSSPILTDQLTWNFDESRHPIRYSYGVNRDAIFNDLFSKIY